ncbi:DNA polymerase/3'-5' exonuclease PolX [Methanobacterium paludis]|uniref:DNA polymerase beta n=1 Tax=Methanobacterium paludis (strain DSM 25820 / JCM 18151 / SWAN1) TaxID=868131 RepID=F6D244_METPW|nr:DNA polymerase/3'-5' exonuclease PolX [Methanobacterium paludis]AEG17910.1 PHP domain protein [Methanobacterium paludis]
MKNRKVATILNRIADLLEMDGVDFRTKAYRRAAHTVEFLSRDIQDVRNEGKLEELPGIGKNLSKKIEEIIDTGSLEYYENLKKEFPVDFEALVAIEGLGPKSIKLLYDELGIKNLEDLEKAAKRHRIRRLKGMGDKKEHQIIENLKFARKTTGRTLLGQILPLAEGIKKELEKSDVSDVEIAGSIRRMQETVGDIDILVVTDKPKQVMDYFTSMDEVGKIIVKGLLKSTIRLKNGVQVDIRVFNEDSFGSALLYFTGSKETNIDMRKIAIRNGLKLNEYGVYMDEKQIAGKTEEEVFRKLGMQYIEPELRENRGEIEAALKGKLPKLVEYNEIMGDLQIHTKWSDGDASIQDMAQKTGKLGYEYIAVTDHTGSLKIAGGMDENGIKRQIKEIDKLNQNLDEIIVLKGVEVNIDSEGRLDVSNELLENMDIVVAALHSGFRQSREKLTGRIVSAMENEHVNIIAHPTGRKIHYRMAYELDLEKIFEVSKETGTFLEVNSQPNRLDLKDINIKRAIEEGCKLVINTDAHNLDQLSYMKLGTSTARRGWAESKDIINTLPLKKLEKLLS